jgi:protein-L-isoaspartate(D-aspartate) O-methyltransferase
MDSRQEMIVNQLLGRDIRDSRVLAAMGKINRENFVPDHLRHRAYEDNALPIGKGQTISQPYIVAYMAQNMDLREDDIVLEIGSGCGYNAAVLSVLVKHVYTIEIIEWLSVLSKENLEKEGINNVTTLHGDGYKGWAEHAPYDKIMITAAAPYIPEPLKKQLAVGGKLLIPVGMDYQKLILLDKLQEDVFEQHDLINVRFVPLTGGIR